MLVILISPGAEILPVRISPLAFRVIFASSVPVIVPVPVMLSACIVAGERNLTPLLLLFSGEYIVIVPEFSDLPMVIDAKPFAKVAKSDVVRLSAAVFSKPPRVIF